MASERAFVTKEEHTVHGRTVEVYIYSEEYSKWFGLRKYYRRHVRAEAPHYFHSREDPEEVSLQEQVNEILEEVKEDDRNKAELAKKAK